MPKFCTCCPGRGSHHMSCTPYKNGRVSRTTAYPEVVSLGHFSLEAKVESDMDLRSFDRVKIEADRLLSEVQPMLSMYGHSIWAIAWRQSWIRSWEVICNLEIARRHME